MTAGPSPVTRRGKKQAKSFPQCAIIKQIRHHLNGFPSRQRRSWFRHFVRSLIPRARWRPMVSADGSRRPPSTSAPWGGHDAACRRGPSCSLQYHGPSTCRNFRRSRSFRRGTRRGGAYAPPRLLPSQACSAATKHRLIEGPPYGDEQDRRREQEHPWPPH